LNKKLFASLFLAVAQLGFAQDAPVVAEYPAMVSYHPRVFIAAEPMEGLRTVDDVREAIKSGHANRLWEALLAKVDEEREQPAWGPFVETQWRSAAAAKQGNRDYTLVGMTSNRIADAALVALILEDRTYVDAALKQIYALFDEEQWPEWADMAHLNKGLHADLRHGQLVMPVAVAYDWMYHLLTDEERQLILDGIETYAIEPYKKAVEAEEPFARRQTNWMTVMAGGFGIAGMALAGDHPDAEWLIEFARPRMEAYLDILGPDGEFNESVQYAGSMNNVVRYFTALRYATGGKDKPFERHSLDKFCEWYMYMTMPPGRVVGFGDPAPDMPPVVDYISAIAAARQNPKFQWFYMQYGDMMLDTHRKRALELLYFDDGIEAESPAGDWPLAAAYDAEAKIVTSRASWDPESTPSVVYTKAARESSHNHADWGQLCIDGYGDRLIVDLGSTPGYPDGHKERYYNYQQWGHNVFVFGEKNETGGTSWTIRDRQGKNRYVELNQNGLSRWTIDTTGVYESASLVTRQVIHHLPRVVAVYDTALLVEDKSISLRWHTATPVEPDPVTGNFVIQTEHATLVGCIAPQGGVPSIRTGHHAYAAPYDKDRLGEPYKPRNEPYIEAYMTGDSCSVLTVFCVFPPTDDPPRWKIRGRGYRIETPEGPVTVVLEDLKLTIDSP
jgi:hypothetical protein